MAANKKMILLALAQKCPRCGQGDLYQSGFSLTLRPACLSCGLDFSKSDAGDGPAVLLIFILGFLLVPAALLVESLFHPPLWVHGMVWGVVLLGMTIGAMRPIKAYVIALHFKHRFSDRDQ